MIARRCSTAVLALALAASGMGCDDPVRVGGPPAGGGPEPGPAQAMQDAGPPADAHTGGLGVYRDEDFVEAESNRDPFRNYAKLFKVRPSEDPQRITIMSTTGIDEVRLIAIISNIPRPRAMLLDPIGVGHVVERGDFLGRAEVVQTGGAEGTPVTLNWRVDRIRPNEVVLSREDPTAPNRPPLTRVIPLHDEEPEGIP